MALINILTLVLLIVSCSDNPTIPRGGIGELKFGLHFDNPAWHPDGKWIAVEHSDSIDTDFDGIGDILFSGIWVINAETGYKQPLIRHFSYPDWSPDGNWIAHHRYISNGETGTEIYIMDTSGTNATWLEHGAGTKFSPDGNLISFYDSPRDGLPPAIWTIRTDGTELRQITNGPDSSFDWSPDGNQIVFLRRNFNEPIEGNGQLWVINTDGTNLRQLTFFEGLY